MVHGAAGCLWFCWQQRFRSLSLPLCVHAVIIVITIQLRSGTMWCALFLAAFLSTGWVPRLTAESNLAWTVVTDKIQIKCNHPTNHNVFSLSLPEAAVDSLLFSSTCLFTFIRLRQSVVIDYVSVEWERFHFISQFVFSVSETLLTSVCESEVFFPVAGSSDAMMTKTTRLSPDVWKKKGDFQ